ncbi:MAG: magnesium/cobalt transporter CorA [Proteobacteria bacterium]|nr:magnesium/cobalt transporter CorA [Pseudomonadota bacterium]MBU1585598.1 magnesium/cobalt transporter CorA [Pseudomonadota bacterium]MBU2455418.1 magnesium/cobalt transporter CorA [Pseudomonadota bacterium]MBU2627399.1 magnesium/cobalt transporter CorA [Pseudomonadota bacterium]
MKSLKKTSEKTGFSPGTLVHIGEKRIEKTRIRIMDYNPDQIREKEIKHIEECFPFKDEPSITWINIDGLHETDLIEKIGGHFDVHPLILEDIVHAGTRPKIEEFDSFTFIVFKMLYYDENAEDILDEQISILLGTNFVISFQEREGTVFNPLRDRIRNPKSRIRRKGADYLTYALIDTVVDNYFIILEMLEDKIEALDEDLFTSMSKETFHSINNMKRKLIALRKAVSPLRELVNAVQKKEFSLIEESNLIYFKDIYDHVVQIMETVDIYRELVSGLHDIFLTNVNNKMNEIMKTLTITATIFIPLTFIAGIYGMNFKYMPELEWEWGYVAVWAVIIGVVGTMFYYFKKKDWL